MLNPTPTIFDLMCFNPTESKKTRINDNLSFTPDPKYNNWLNINGFQEKDKIEKLLHELNIHQLIIDDVLDIDCYPKISLIEDTICVIVNNIILNHHNEEFEIFHCGLIFKKGLVISIQDSDRDFFESFEDLISNPTSRLRLKSADFLFYKILNAVQESYYDALYKFSTVIDKFEETVFDTDSQELMKSIKNYKRQLILLKKVILPLRQITIDLINEDTELFDERSIKYLRDLKDHTYSLFQLFEEINDSLSLSYDMYMSSINNRMNEIIKTLTIISFIFIPLNFIAGFYGMNFEHIPNLHDPYGLWIALSLMVGALITSYLFFKRNKWF